MNDAKDRDDRNSEKRDEPQLHRDQQAQQNHTDQDSVFKGRDFLTDHAHDAADDQEQHEHAGDIGPSVLADLHRQQTDGQHRE